MIDLFTKMLKGNIHLTLYKIGMLNALWYNIQLKKKNKGLKENRNKNLNYQLRRSGLSHDLSFLQKIYVVLICCSNAT